MFSYKNRTENFCGRMLNITLIIFILGFCVTLMVGSAEAAEVRFRIIVVKASSEGSGFDDSLNAYKKQLMAMGYRSGQVTSRSTLNLNIGAKGNFNVAGNITAEITPISLDADFIRFDFKMFREGKQITGLGYRIPNDAHTILVGPMQEKTKYLIIIRASQ